MGGDRLDFWAMKEITFDKPDFDNFRGLALAYEAGRTGGSLPVVFNAANEMAVARFLNREISYLEITDIIEASMKNHKIIDHPTLEQVLAAEQETYEFIKSGWGR